MMKRRNFITALAAMVAARKITLPVEPGPVFPVQFNHHETVHRMVPVTAAPDGGVRFTRTGLPSVYWKEVNSASELQAVMMRTNEILLELPWVEKRGS